MAQARGRLAELTPRLGGTKLDGIAYGECVGVAILFRIRQLAKGERPTYSPGTGKSGPFLRGWSFFGAQAVFECND